MGISPTQAVAYYCAPSGNPSLIKQPLFPFESVTQEELISELKGAFKTKYPNSLFIVRQIDEETILIKIRGNIPGDKVDIVNFIYDGYENLIDDLGYKHDDFSGIQVDFERVTPPW